MQALGEQLLLFAIGDVALHDKHGDFFLVWTWHGDGRGVHRTQFWLTRGNGFDVLWPNIATVNNQHVFMATGHHNLTVNQVT